MGSLDTPPSWSDPIVLASIERAFDATWPVIRAHEAGVNKARMAELSMALSHKLVELAAQGVTDPEELRKLALEAFPAYSG
jgi:hypothetical protein